MQRIKPLNNTCCRNNVTGETAKLAVVQGDQKSQFSTAVLFITETYLWYDINSSWSFGGGGFSYSNGPHVLLSAIF
jgi:hypothetical protein